MGFLSRRGRLGAGRAFWRIQMDKSLLPQHRQRRRQRRERQRDVGCIFWVLSSVSFADLWMVVWYRQGRQQMTHSWWIVCFWGDGDQICHSLKLSRLYIPRISWPRIDQLQLQAHNGIVIGVGERFHVAVCKRERCRGMFGVLPGSQQDPSPSRASSFPLFAPRAQSSIRTPA